MLLETGDLALRRNTQQNLLQSSVHTRKYLFPSRSVVGDGPQTSQRSIWKGSKVRLFLEG